MKLYLVGILGLSTTACIPGIPILSPPPPPTPATEIMNAAVLEPRDGAGLIVVTRDKSLLRTGCTYDVALDGQVVAGLHSNEYVTIYATPGERTVAVSIRPGGSCDPALAEIPVRVVAHATTSMRIVADASYDLRIELTTY